MTGVLLIHGLTGSPTEMAPLAKALRRAGYHTAVPLIAGHGAGHRELLATTWQEWRDGLRRDLQELLRVYDEVVVAGLCVGGLLGALLASEENRVSGVVLLAPDLGFRMPGPVRPWTRFLLPMAFRVPWLRRHGYWTQKPPYGLKNPRLQQRVAQAIAASAQGQTQEFGTFRTYVGTMLEMIRLRDAVTRSFTQLRCPALVIHSMEDSMFSIRNATTVYRQLGSDRKEIALITGCDHVITVDFRRDEVAWRVARFIASLHGASVPAQGTADGSYSCEIAPGREQGTHDLVVLQGPSAQLVLTLCEESEGRRPRRAAEVMRGDDQAQGLARSAIAALAQGLQTRLTVRPGVQPDETPAAIHEPIPLLEEHAHA